MSRRTDSPSKRTPEILADLLAGHADAARSGHDAARRYLENAIQHNRSMPNAVKFFVYDLLCVACAGLELAERRDEAIALAARYLPDAQEETLRQFTEYLPTIALYEQGIRAASADDRLEDALGFCEAAIALGLGKVYERKAESLRRRL